MFAPAAIVVGPSFVTATSALGMTVVITVDESLAGLVSALSVETMAVFVADVVLPASITSVNWAEALLASATKLQSTSPLSPRPGAEQLAGGPLSWLSETKVVFGGIESERLTLS